MEERLGEVLLGRQIDLHKRRQSKPRHDRRLRADRAKVGVEELELLLTQLDRALLDIGLEQELIRREHLTLRLCLLEREA